MSKRERPTALELLGDALLLDPDHATELMRHAKFHDLMTISRGIVTIRGRTWCIISCRFDDTWVRIRLEKE